MDFDTESGKTIAQTFDGAGLTASQRISFAKDWANIVDDTGILGSGPEVFADKSEERLKRMYEGYCKKADGHQAKLDAILEYVEEGPPALGEEDKKEGVFVSLFSSCTREEHSEMLQLEYKYYSTALKVNEQTRGFILARLLELKKTDISPSKSAEDPQPSSSTTGPLSA